MSQADVQKDKTKQERQQELENKPRQPGFRRGPPIFMEGKSKLDHSRKTLWKWIFSYLTPYRGKFVILFFLLIVGTVINGFIPLLSARIIDRILNTAVPDRLQFLQSRSLLYGIMVIIVGVSNYLSLMGMGVLSQKVVLSIRNDQFSQLQGMSLSFFDSRPSGDIISILTNDIDQLNMLVGGQFVEIITSIISIILTLVIMFLLNPILTLFSLTIIPVFIFLMWLFRKFAIRAFKKARKTISGVTSSIQQNIEGGKTVKAFGQEEKAINEFNEANKQNYEAMYQIRRLMGTFIPAIQFITTILTIGILVSGGILYVKDISLLGIAASVGTLTAFISMLSQFFRPFMMLLQIQNIIESAFASADRILSLLETRVEIKEPKNPLSLNQVNGTIQFQNVSFAYSLNGSEENYEKRDDSEKDSELLPAKNPMIQMALERVKQFPEPYSSYLLEQLPTIPSQIRRTLFMQLMGTDLKTIPEKIDTILGSYGYAVPGTQYAENHPECKNDFGGVEIPGNDEDLLPQEWTPQKEQMFQNMTNMLEKAIKQQMNVSSMGGRQQSGEGGNMISGRGQGSQKVDSSQIARFLAQMNVPPAKIAELPIHVQQIIKEQIRLIQHEQSKGYVLKNLNLSIPAGKTIAIVGHTGAGKTTIIKLIARFYDVDDGKITLDGIDIRKIKKETLREYISMVPQDIFVFSDTIENNLLYAIENPVEDDRLRMVEISKFLGLHNFVEKLPDKYQTSIKEGGVNISTGQRQLIAFARALITDPRVLILDEATSSVDPYTETLIQDALDKARQGRTTIIIAHRLSTIKNADDIVVIGQEEKGIVEQGTHDELMALDGQYKKLLELQFSEIEI
ncbi:MAG: ATP-binding cassette domain-containing protein [Candidatus Lokiarchaeota archaeon]|nr:ATP-binding cassette domain-containing protein [Candidatus Lokiarchaeota archaeon]